MKKSLMKIVAALYIATPVSSQDFGTALLTTIEKNKQEKQVSASDMYKKMAQSDFRSDLTGHQIALKVQNNPALQAAYTRMCFKNLDNIKALQFLYAKLQLAKSTPTAQSLPFLDAYFTLKTLDKLASGDANPNVGNTMFQLHKGVSTGTITKQDLDNALDAYNRVENKSHSYQVIPSNPTFLLNPGVLNKEYLIVKSQLDELVEIQKRSLPIPPENCIRY